MPCTIRSLARHLELSVGTVSQALTGRGEVSAATRERVHQAAEALGYRANSAARAMHEGRFRTIGFIHRAGCRWMPSELLEGASEAADAGGNRLVLHLLPLDTLAQPLGRSRVLRELSLDGALVNLGIDVDRAFRADATSLDVPLVWVNAHEASDCVGIDDRGATQAATARLIALGHRRIAYVGFSIDYQTDRGHVSVKHRRAGYNRAMLDAGLAPRVVERTWLRPTVAGTWGRDDDRLAVAHQLCAGAERPTAVLASSPEGILPVLLAARTLGLAVPRDLSLAVVAPQPVHQTGVALSTWLHPWRAAGAAAVELLHRRTQADRPVDSVVVPFAPEPVGESLAAPAP
jgi:LacI family repressor for deo operon, udp, cdd, tsx, nupC, and nupG